MDRREFLKRTTTGTMGAMIPNWIHSKETQTTPETITQEINTAKRALEQKEYLSSRFLVGALYYSQNFFAHIAKKPNRAPHEEILHQIAQQITPEIRQEYLGFLESKASQIDYRPEAQSIFNHPFNYGHQEHLAHQDALDIFPDNEKLGVGIQAPTGLLILSTEVGWDADEPLSTSSPYGGNMVFAFEPHSKTQWRLAHLEDITVASGAIALPGDRLGTVGSTGLNASKPGHGNHLHLEVHKALPDMSGMISLSRNEIKQLLQGQ